MHAIKSAARRQAWYHNNDPDTSRTYNIFGRGTRNPRRLPDEEDGTGSRLSHVMSESDATSPVEAKRRDEWGQRSLNSAGTYGGVRRSGTFPASSSDHRPTSKGIPGNDTREKEEVEQHAHYDEAEITDETSKDSNISDTPQPGSTLDMHQAAGSNGPRRRKKFLGIPLPGKKYEDDDLSRTETGHSSVQSSRPKKFAHLKFTQWGQCKKVFGSWINLLLVFVPIGLASYYGNLSPGLTFSMNFIAIIPLAAMLSYATEELACYVGETFGGLLNASFGNATELIVSIIALTQQQVLIVQTSLIGSMLSNLLLVLGMCFFFGGINRMEQHFNITVAQTAASLLALAIGAVVTPTAFRIFSDNDAGVDPLSRAASILLLLTYICYLFFQLRTHIDMYNKPSEKSKKQNLIVKNKKPQQEVNISKGLATIGARASATAGGPVNSQNLVQKPEEEDQEDEPQLSIIWAVATLVASTALIAVTSDGLVSAIDGITEPDGPLSKEFVGLILIPIVGNAAEHATAVTVAIKDKMDLAIGVAVGSSLQIVLLVLPFMVLLGWFGVGQPDPVVMNLNFDGFQVVVLFIAIILVNYVIQDGSSHWLEGVMLMITYIIFAVAAWYYPQNAVPL